MFVVDMPALSLLGSTSSSDTTILRDVSIMADTTASPSFATWLLA